MLNSVTNDDFNRLTIDITRYNNHICAHLITYIHCIYVFYEYIMGVLIGITYNIHILITFVVLEFKRIV